MIEQEPLCGVRTHFYYDASTHDWLCDHRVVEFYIRLRIGAQFMTLAPQCPLRYSRIAFDICSIYQPLIFVKNQG